MKMNSKLLFYKEGEARSQYVHTGRKMSTLPGRKAQFERVPINKFNFCGKTTSKVNILYTGQTTVII